MAKKRVCDVCGNEVNYGKPKIWRTALLEEVVNAVTADGSQGTDGNKPEERDLCDPCAEKWNWVTADPARVKRLFLSITLSKSKQPKIIDAEKVNINFGLNTKTTKKENESA